MFESLKFRQLGNRINAAKIKRDAAKNKPKPTRLLGLTVSTAKRIQIAEVETAKTAIVKIVNNLSREGFKSKKILVKRDFKLI